MKLLGSNETEDGSKIVKIEKGSTRYIILIPSHVRGKDEGKYIQREVLKHEQQFTSGRF